MARCHTVMVSGPPGCRHSFPKDASDRHWTPRTRVAPKHHRYLPIVQSSGARKQFQSFHFAVNALSLLMQIIIQWGNKASFGC